MAMDLGAKGSLKADINVTPLVDVMLVLLIIMMIIAPMLQKGVDVKLPTASNTTDKPETQDQTVVAVDASGRMFLQSLEVPEIDLARWVTEYLETKNAKIVSGCAAMRISRSRISACVLGIAIDPFLLGFRHPLELQ